MWISEIESSLFFGEEVDDHLSAAQLGYSGNKDQDFFFWTANKGQSMGG